jgi:hypothetical protein
MTKSCGNVKNLIGGVDDPLEGEKMRIVLLAEETHQHAPSVDLSKRTRRRKIIL